MRSFIELTKMDSKPICINVNSIVYINTTSEGNAELTFNLPTENGNPKIKVLESYTEVTNLIHKIL